jgi:hypothetical protein
MSSLPKHRILIIGDSHARGCAERLSDPSSLQVMLNQMLI